MVLMRSMEKGAWVILRTGLESKYLNAAPGWMTGGVRLLSPGGALDELMESHPDRKIYTYDREKNGRSTVTKISEEKN